MTGAWVVGSGGLIGGSLLKQLEFDGIPTYRPPFGRWLWHDERQFAGQIAIAIDAFARWAAGLNRWSIYWSAGASGMSSPATTLAVETRHLAALVEGIAGCRQLLAMNGAFALVSSAGGIYAGSRMPLISEATPVAPTTPYGLAKLDQEALLSHPALQGAGCKTLLARVSTVYGPSQATGGRQGLISHLARCAVTGEPARVFVPLDTVRDYVLAEDVARMIISSLDCCQADTAPTVKIVASGNPSTVADILGTFRRLSRKALRYTTGLVAASSLYEWRSRFRSIVMSEQPLVANTPLLLGVAKTLTAARKAVASPTNPWSGE
jgi:UDP-glucose 4-epimerase